MGESLRVERGVRRLRLWAERRRHNSALLELDEQYGRKLLEVYAERDRRAEELESEIGRLRNRHEAQLLEVQRSFEAELERARLRDERGFCGPQGAPTLQEVRNWRSSSWAARLNQDDAARARAGGRYG